MDLSCFGIPYLFIIGTKFQSKFFITVGCTIKFEKFYTKKLLQATSTNIFNNGYLLGSLTDSLSLDWKKSSIKIPFLE